MSAVVGVVLAAGAGTRYGGPKALARDEAGRSWIERTVATLRAGGCASVLVALGAGAGEAARLVPADAAVLVVPEWADGLSATLRAALASLIEPTSPVSSTAPAARVSSTAPLEPGADAALIVPVDTPAMPPGVCARVIAGASRASLARAVYQGVPGHPVLIGRDHWAPAGAHAVGDQGAGPYLRAHAAAQIECGDLWDGADIDRPVVGSGQGS